ncbi:MAG: AraC family transcriptional regulator [Bacteroidaceae bacterium]|nr:AraC family transcriptional regulator [Bacteroidaceae bacterium]
MDFIDNLIPMLPFMVCLFWAVHAGISYRELNRAQRHLGLFLSVSMFLFLFHAVYYSASRTPSYNLLTVIYSWATLTAYPLYYLYIKSITDYHNPSKFEMVLWFSPGLIAAVASVSVLLFGLRHEVPDTFISIVRPIQTVLVCVISLIKLTAFDRSVYDSYSEVEGKTAKPIIILATLQFTAALCTVVLTILGPRYFTGKTILAIPSVLFAGIIYAIAYVGFRYRFGAYQMEIELKEDAIPADKENEESLLFNVIQEKMENERLYLKPSLSVVDLAKAIGSNRTYVSTSINSHSGKSFAMFVNTYRVEYAKKIMEKDGKLSVAQVAEMSGFASEESFRRNFRNITGKSPSDWTGSVRL